MLKWNDFFLPLLMLKWNDFSDPTSKERLLLLVTASNAFWNFDLGVSVAEEDAVEISCDEEVEDLRDSLLDNFSSVWCSSDFSRISSYMFSPFESSEPSSLPLYSIAAPTRIKKAGETLSL